MTTMQTFCCLVSAVSKDKITVSLAGIVALQLPRDEGLDHVKVGDVVEFKLHYPPQTTGPQMPTLDAHQSNTYVKLLVIGDAKSGKTGSLVSLVKAGYKLRILDFDNLLDVLKYYVQKECPDKIGNVEYRSLRDKRKATPTGHTIDGKAEAFIKGIRMLDHWKYTEGGQEVDLGKPWEWDSDCILVIDSLSRFCDAAYDWQASMAPANADGRAIYGNAQDAIEGMLAQITAPNYTCNVIVIAHVKYMDLPDGTTKGFPQGVGQKLSPVIPQYFPSIVLYTNQGGKRQIRTNSSPLIDLANPAPFAMQPTYDAGEGLAKFFAVLRDPPKGA